MAKTPEDDIGVVGIVTGFGYDDNENPKLFGHLFKNQKDFYKKPVLSSKVVHEFLVSHLNNEVLEMWSVKDVLGKMCAASLIENMNVPQDPFNDAHSWFVKRLKHCY